MKYKPGDEVFIKAEITDVSGYECSERPYFVTPYIYSVNWVSEDKIIPMDKTYADGLKDAWELAKKIMLATDDGGISLNDITEIFGSAYCAMRDFTYEEALAKIEAYEKEKEIKVGDVVHVFPVAGGEYSAVVVRRNDGNADVLYNDGLTANAVPLKLVKKTGKHIDIESLLRQIGE